MTKFFPIRVFTMEVGERGKSKLFPNWAIKESAGQTKSAFLKNSFLFVINLPVVIQIKHSAF
ncbi:hypothetical protein [Persicobacter diffluens]|uniref:hypothetical protein n=1 Tax=Persicobacter diffluens TaxID=981 RepID=UPI0030C71F5B